MWSAQWILTVINLSFLGWNQYFFIHAASQYPHEAEWTLFQTHYFSENLAAPEIKPGSSASVATRPQVKINDKNITGRCLFSLNEN
jgi:hypothetical protein